MQSVATLQIVLQAAGLQANGAQSCVVPAMHMPAALHTDGAVSRAVVQVPALQLLPTGHNLHAPAPSHPPCR